MKFARKIAKRFKRKWKNEHEIQVPSKKDVLCQLHNHFRGIEPEIDVQALADIISREFSKLKHPSKKDRNTHVEAYRNKNAKATLSILEYYDEKSRFHDEFNELSKYHTLVVRNYKKFRITIVEAERWIKLSYVRNFRMEEQA